MGTRRTEELIAEIRSLSYTEVYSFTEGWNDNTVVDILNLGLEKLYMAITQEDQPAYIHQSRLDVVSGQGEYDIPFDVQMAIRIMDVRFLYGTQEWEFFELPQAMIQDRWSYVSTYPTNYCIRNGKIVLSPTPGMSMPGGLVINYQKRIRTLDVRRGKVTSIDTTGPVEIQLNFTVDSQKDTHLQANGESVLDKIDWCCLVDRNGDPIVSSIPLASYDFTTQILTAENDYVVPADQLAALNAALAANQTVYVTQGYYSSSNSELDPVCEQYLVEYSACRLLDLQSDAIGRGSQKQREDEILAALVAAFRRYRPVVYPVRWVRRFSPAQLPMIPKGFL